MILSGPAIRKLVEESARLTPEQVQARRGLEYTSIPYLRIAPFDETRCGPNSYDVTLADRLLVYQRRDPHSEIVLDTRTENPTWESIIPPEGYVLRPGTLYLGSLAEHVECHGLVPWIDGRSSIGRLGLSVHVTAGRGDDGWSGHFTLELNCVHPVRIYAGLRIGQLTFMNVVGQRQPYKGKYKGDLGPVASRLHQDRDDKPQQTVDWE